MPFLFTHVEYCDMHYVYGYCDGNASATASTKQRDTERAYSVNQ